MKASRWTCNNEASVFFFFGTATASNKDNLPLPENNGRVERMELNSSRLSWAHSLQEHLRRLTGWDRYSSCTNDVLDGAETHYDEYASMESLGCALIGSVRRREYRGVAFMIRRRISWAAMMRRKYYSRHMLWAASKYTINQQVTHCPCLPNACVVLISTSTAIIDESMYNEIGDILGSPCANFGGWRL
jgi:hypothetical protein